MWIWKELTDLKVPKPIIKSAFQVVVEHDWQGIAYLMLEVAELNFIIALRVRCCNILFIITEGKITSF
jgi:hypothetical protein